MSARSNGPGADKMAPHTRYPQDDLRGARIWRAGQDGPSRTNLPQSPWKWRRPLSESSTARLWFTRSSQGRDRHGSSEIHSRGVAMNRRQYLFLSTGAAIGSLAVAEADSTNKGPLCQGRDRRSELRPAETRPTTADRGRHLAEPARPLAVRARESSPFTRICQRITAQANSRPSRHSGPGGDEQDAAVRPGDRLLAALGSDAPDRRSPQCRRDGPESAR